MLDRVSTHPCAGSANGCPMLAAIAGVMRHGLRSHTYARGLTPPSVSHTDRQRSARHPACLSRRGESDTCVAGDGRQPRGRTEKWSDSSDCGTTAQHTGTAITERPDLRVLTDAGPVAPGQAALPVLLFFLLLLLFFSSQDCIACPFLTFPYFLTCMCMSFPWFPCFSDIAGKAAQKSRLDLLTGCVHARFGAVQSSDALPLTAYSRGICRRTADRRWAFARSRLADASAVR